MSLDILIDFDDVLYDWSGTAHRLCEEAGITNGKKITQWAFEKDYGVSREAVWEVLEAATLDGSLYDAPPIPGTLNQLRRLRYAGHRVHIVTARGFGNLGWLVEMYTRDYVLRENVPLDSLTFTEDKTEVKVDVALDDGVHNVKALIGAGANAYLMNAAHNQDEKDLPRVHSVREFADKFVSFGEE